MSALDDATVAAELLSKEFTRLGLDVHAYGGLAIWSGSPVEGGEPYVSIQGPMTPRNALMIARALSMLPSPDETR